MADLQALVSFTNIAYLDSATITLSHGITPSQAVITILPQERNINTRGDLVWWEGKTKMKWVDALADEARYRFNRSGHVVQITVLDRRWKWQFPTISGHYNVRDHTGTITKDKGTADKPDKKLAVSDSERTVKELIELCLKALGETGYKIDNIPDELRPEVHWEKENAAQALQSLCTMVGCRVVLQLDNKVGIRKQGVGKKMPPGPVEEYGAQLDPPDKPSKLIAVCGPTWFQVDLELEAVGMERDGEVKNAEDVSYLEPYKDPDAPGLDPVLFEEIEHDQDRELALQTVFRWFRVKLPLTVKGYDGPEIRHHKQILLLPVQVYARKVLDVVQNRPAIVWGEWYDDDAGENVGGTVTDIFDYALLRSIVPFSFDVDQDRCLVKFTEPVYYSQDGRATYPVIKLRCAIQIRDATTGEWVRHKKELKLDPKSNTKPREIVIDELRLEVAAGKERNRDKIDKELQKRLDIIKGEYEFETPEFAIYTGWLNFELDGAIQSVTWTMGADGATTTIQRNDDRGSASTQSYRLRRQNELYAQSLRAAAKLDPQKQIPSDLRNSRVEGPG